MICGKTSWKEQEHQSNEITVRSLRSVGSGPLTTEWILNVLCRKKLKNESKEERKKKARKRGRKKEFERKKKNVI